MTCTEIVRELKCKFPSCPCQKCTKERNDNGKDSVNHELYQRDTPPERPQPKYQFQCKCLCKPETLHRRKCPPALPQPRQPIAKTSRGCSEMDDCNTGKGCCNTERNFISFMMNIIGLIAFLLLATIVFWLFLLKCTVILGVRVYHSNRTTQVAVVSGISLLFLLIFCTAAATYFQRYLARRSACKFSDPSKCKSQATSAATPYIKSKSASTSSWFSFKWSKSKEIVPKQVKTRYPWTLRKETSVSKAQTSSSWIPFIKWSHTSTKVVESPNRKSWLPTSIGRQTTTTTTKTDYTPKKSETRSSWLPSFGWRQAPTTTITKEGSNTRTSWIPSFIWRHTRTTTTITKETTKKSETRRSSWIPSFIWRQTSTTMKEVEYTPKPHSSWLPSYSWSRTSAKETSQPAEVTVSRSSWLPLFLWGHSPREEIETTTTQTVDRTFWRPPIHLPTSLSTYFRSMTTKEVQIPKKESKRSSSWLPSTWWSKTTTTTEIAPSQQKTAARSSWLPSFNWRQTTTTTTTTTKNMKKPPQKKSETSTSSWLPSFIWRSPVEKIQSALTACGMKQQKVTVTITDDEARQIYKKSKLYAIPTEMKQPPNLVIYLRDWIQRNTD
uniref:Uncharacterized protein n=1 Tax=Ceratitis capitata TaxID=7213 RepID=W8BDM1_CERCA